jgi:hypothetical protein
MLGLLVIAIAIALFFSLIPLPSFRNPPNPPYPNGGTEQQNSQQNNLHNLPLKIRGTKGVMSDTQEETTSDDQLRTIQNALNALEMSIKSITPPSEPTPPKQKPRLPQAELHRTASQSVVSLLCDEEGGTIAIATGNIIHPAGYILTNAHIVDKANKEQECTVRRGSPAQPFAIAKLLFTPTAFTASTSVLEQIKWDMAIWKIDRPSGATPLPETFEALTLDRDHHFSAKEALATFSYPAELLSKEVILTSLYLVFSETEVEAIDEFFIQSLAGLGSQQGSSGGALIDPTSGKFVGLIFAINKETEINKRRLFALHPARLGEIMKIETGKTLEEYLAAKP